MLCSIVLVCGFAVRNALQNLESQGVATGFGFLDEVAGFGISQSLVAYDETQTYGRTFLVGLLNTLLVSSLGIVAASMLGFIVGVARLSHNWLLAKLASVFVETFRNIPLLLQIMFWYFAVLSALPGPRQSMALAESLFLNVRGFYLPSLQFEASSGQFWLPLVLAVVAVSIWTLYCQRFTRQTGRKKPWFSVAMLLAIGAFTLLYVLLGGAVAVEYPRLQGFNFTGGITILPELLALWLGLTIYTASFIAEVVRSGIQAIPKGQVEAGLSLGLSRRQVLKLVVVPQALRVIIPPLTNQYLNLTKNSSLATAIGYPDLVAVFAGTTLNQTGQAIEVVSMTMLVYLIISLAVSLFMNWFNQRVRLIER